MIFSSFSSPPLFSSLFFASLFSSPLSSLVLSLLLHVSFSFLFLLLFSLLLSPSFSLFRLLFSLSVFFLRVLVVCVCVGVVVCVVVCVCVCGVCGVVWCAVWCGTLKTPVCRLKNASVCRFKTSRVCRQHAHMLKHMCAWCRYTRERFECTHGKRFDSTHGGHPRGVITCFRSSPKVTTGCCPCSSLRIDREQHVPDSSSHSLCLIKLLSNRYCGETLEGSSREMVRFVFRSHETSITNDLRVSIS